MIFKTSIKEARESAALTQKDAAALLGISKRTLESWEEGTRQPKPAEQARALEELRKHRKTRQELIAEQLAEIVTKNCDILDPRQQARLSITAQELAPKI